jgi:uncharacterized membrane protein (DUF2068 family)
VRRPLDPGICLIALFELVKGTLVAISAVGLLTVKRIRVDPDNYYVHTVITRLSGLTARQLEAISGGSLLYAVLRYVEGLGLMWRR